MKSSLEGLTSEKTIQKFYTHLNICIMKVTDLCVIIGGVVFLIITLYCNFMVRVCKYRILNFHKKRERDLRHLKVSKQVIDFKCVPAVYVSH